MNGYDIEKFIMMIRALEGIRSAARQSAEQGDIYFTGQADGLAVALSALHAALDDLLEDRNDCKTKD